MVKDQLSRDQRRLRQKLGMLKAMAYRNSRAERTISECSSSTTSTASTTSTSYDEHGMYMRMYICTWPISTDRVLETTVQLTLRRWAVSCVSAQCQQVL